MPKPEYRAPLDLVARDSILETSIENAPEGTSETDALVWRWLPWILSYSGVRASDALRAKGEDFLHFISGGETDFPCVSVRSNKRVSGLLYPLHPILLDMGLQDVARGRMKRPLFLDGDDTPIAADLALERYRTNLTGAGLSPEPGPIVMPLRRLFQSQLTRAGIESRYIEMLMGRSVEPSRFMEPGAELAYAARALSRLPPPHFYGQGAELRQDV